ncbi:hypothetical protein ACN47A_26560 [Myxococcus fulvus]|uniref:hypothetical protein n=1 Tax=Myxococcus fulvus TaxID=33 RepID=UPI003B99A654
MDSVIERLSHKLGLPPSDPSTQDWAIELSEAFKTPEHLEHYVSAYTELPLMEVERELLMDLILATSDDLIGTESGLSAPLWGRVEGLLTTHWRLHAAQVDYWAVLDESYEDGFNLTPRIRVLRARLVT